MSQAAVAGWDEADPYKLGRGTESTAPGVGTGGPADKRIVVGYGFWIFLLSDIVMFSAFFAAFAVLRDATAGGPTGRDLFSPGAAALETAVLLLSTFSCAVAGAALKARRAALFQAAMAVTFVLGATFVVLEAQEFSRMIAAGAGPDRSAFLSAFFALVGCHGFHVSVGLLWLLTMMAQVYAKGMARTERRVLCFGLFWHALDIVWVAVVTVVYLMGVSA